MANFDDLQGAVAQFGANNKVIFDDTGMPSIMGIFVMASVFLNSSVNSGLVSFFAISLLR